MENLRIGQKVNWLHTPRGGWGYQFRVPATVLRVGSKKVTIKVIKKDGSEVDRHVLASSLNAVD